MKDDSASMSNRISHALDMAGRLLILVAPLLVTFAIVADWAYYLLIDPSMFRTMNIADHVSGILETLPAAGIGLLVGGTITATIFVTYPPNAIAGVGRSAKDRRRIFNAVRFALAAVVIGLLASTIFVTFFPVRVFLLVLLLATLPTAALALCRWIPSTSQMTVLSVAHLTFVYLLMAFLMGVEFAASDLASSFPTHRIVRASGDTIEHAMVFRATQQGLYVRDLDTRVQLLVTWPEVKEVARLNSSVPTFEQLMCRFARKC